MLMFSVCDGQSNIALVRLFRSFVGLWRALGTIYLLALLCNSLVLDVLICVPQTSVSMSGRKDLLFGIITFENHVLSGMSCTPPLCSRKPNLSP